LNFHCCGNTGFRLWAGQAARQGYLTFCAILFLLLPAPGQDWIKTGTGLGVEKIRLAVPDFKSSTQDPKNADLLRVFNGTLWSDLDNAGIFDLVSKSFYPVDAPGNPAEIKFEAWNVQPVNAAMLAFGNAGASGNGMTVQGWLYDVKNVTSPQILGKQYTDAATADAARITAHKFADEIIFRLGGGIPGIAETQIYFVSNRSGHKEIWAMDYDGENQHQITHLNSISLSLQLSYEIRLANPDVLDGPQPAGFIPAFRRNEPFPGVVAGWQQARICILSDWRS
jgi:TolB protein